VKTQVQIMDLAAKKKKSKKKSIINRQPMAF
jgi:hypothetical protein